MKAPSKNVSKSLRGQNSPGRGPEQVQVDQGMSKPSMTVPGDGGVEAAPGTAHQGERSAEKYTEPMKRFGG